MQANLYLCRKCQHLDVKHGQLSSEDKEKRKEYGDETIDWYQCWQHLNEADPNNMNCDFDKNENLIGWVYFESNSICSYEGFKFPKNCPYILEHSVDPDNDREDEEDYCI